MRVQNIHTLHTLILTHLLAWCGYVKTNALLVQMLDKSIKKGVKMVGDWELGAYMDRRLWRKTLFWWNLCSFISLFELFYCFGESYLSLRWRHNGCDGVSNHQPHDCLLNRLFRGRSKKTSKLHVTGLCAENSPGTGEFPAQMVSYAENVSIWWRHHIIASVNRICDG